MDSSDEEDATGQRRKWPGGMVARKRRSGAGAAQPPGFQAAQRPVAFVRSEAQLKEIADQAASAAKDCLLPGAQVSGPPVSESTAADGRDETANAVHDWASTPPVGNKAASPNSRHAEENEDENVTAANKDHDDEVARAAAFAAIVGPSRKRKNDDEAAEPKLDRAKEAHFKAVSGKDGFALKVLKSLGFAGRLGKHGQGISQPIEVAPRRNPQAGIGAQGAERSAKLNESVNVELFGTEEEIARLRRRQQRSEQEEREEAELKALWKRVKQLDGSAARPQVARSGPKRRYRTAAEVARDALRSADKGLVVIDMRRGGVVSNLAKASGYNRRSAAARARASGRSHSGSESEGEGESGSDSESSSGSRSNSDLENGDSEAQHKSGQTSQPAAADRAGEKLAAKISKLADQLESRVATVSFQANRLERAVEAKKAAVVEAERAAEVCAQEAEEIEDTVAAIERSVSAARQEALNARAWRLALRELRSLWAGLPGIQVFNFDEDLAALLVFRELLGRPWQLSSQEEVDELVAMLSAWVPFLTKEGLISSHELNSLFTETILVTVETEIRRAWATVDSVKDSQERRSARLVADEFALGLLGVLEPFVSEKAIREAAVRAALPELERRVETWRFRPGTPNWALHVWILPWVGILRKPIRAKLHRPIRQTLVRTLASKCHGARDLEEWAIQLVLPWTKVLSEGTMDRLVRDGLLPTLSRVLNETPVGPEDMDPAPVRSVLEVAKGLTEDGRAALFESAFFPRWLDAAQACAKGATPVTAGRWYTRWRAALAPLLALKDTRIEACMGRALQHVGAAAGVKRDYAPRHGPVLAPSFEEALRARERQNVEASNAKASAGRQSVPVEVRRPHELSMREFLSLVAPRLGVAFMRDPQSRVSASGQPVYLLDSKPVVILSDVCHRGDPAHAPTTWVPVGLAQLLDAH